MTNPFVTVSLKGMKERLVKGIMINLNLCFSYVMKRKSIPVAKRVKGLNLLVEYGLYLDEGMVYLLSEKFCPEYEQFLRKIPMAPSLVVRKEVHVGLAQILLDRGVPFVITSTKLHQPSPIQTQEFGRFVVEKGVPFEGVSLFRKLFPYSESFRETAGLVRNARNMGDWTYTETGFRYGDGITYSLVFDVLCRATYESSMEERLKLLRLLMDCGAAFQDAWGERNHNSGCGYSQIESHMVGHVEEDLFWQFLKARKFFEVDDDHLPQRMVTLGKYVTELVHMLAKASEPEFESIFHFIEALFQRGAFFGSYMVSCVLGFVNKRGDKMQGVIHFLKGEHQERLIRILTQFCPFEKRGILETAAIENNAVNLLETLEREWVIRFSAKHLRLAIQNSATHVEQWLLDKGVKLY